MQADASPRRMAPGEKAGTRKSFDSYDTPGELAVACCLWLDRHLGIGKNPSILDPCAGSGSFVRAAKHAWGPSCKVVALDIRPECQAPCLEAGARAFACLDSTKIHGLGGVDLIVTNPPFKLADELARHLLLEMRLGSHLAFLLSLTFLGSVERWRPATTESPGGLFVHFPPRLVAPIVPRPDFLTTSPKFECGLFVWRKGVVMGEDETAYSTVIPGEPIRWVKPKKPRKKSEPRDGVSS